MMPGMFSLSDYLRLLEDSMRLRGVQSPFATRQSPGFSAITPASSEGPWWWGGGADSGPGGAFNTPSSTPDLSVAGRTALAAQLADPTSAVNLALHAMSALGMPGVKALTMAMAAHNQSAINEATALTFPDPQTMNPVDTESLSIPGIISSLPTAATASPGFGFAYSGSPTGFMGPVGMQGPQGAGFALGPALAFGPPGTLNFGFGRGDSPGPTGDPNADAAAAAAADAAAGMSGIGAIGTPGDTGGTPSGVEHQGGPVERGAWPTGQPGEEYRRMLVGEFVVQKAPAVKYAKLLHAINADQPAQVKRLAGG